MASKSDLLRARDARDAYRLIGECLDLVSDPALWYVHMLDGLQGLIGAAAAIGGEGQVIRRGGRHLVPLSAFHAGLDAHGRNVLTTYLRHHGPARDPFHGAVARIPGQLMIRRREDVVRDGVYFASDIYDEYLIEASLCGRRECSPSSTPSWDG